MITSIWLRPGEDLTVPYSIREEVFQKELGWTKEADQDVMDAYAYHLVLLLNDVPVATGRLSYDGVDMARLSRICVLKKYRCQGIGDGLVKVLDYKASQLGMGHSRVETIRALEVFYMRIGYLATGTERTAGGMELITMEKETNDGTRENCAHQCTCS